MLPIEVDQLPPASSYLNYAKIGPPVGSYLGPNTMGEYVTVVSNKRVPYGETIRHRVGVAFGIYTVGGEATDPDGLPPEVAYEAELAKIRSDWQALKTPGITVQHRAGKPGRIIPERLVAEVNDPKASVKVTGIEP